MNFICHCTTPLIATHNTSYTCTTYRCNQHFKKHFKGNYFIVDDQSQELTTYVLVFPNKQVEFIGDAEIKTFISYRNVNIANFPFIPLYTQDYLQQAEQIIDKVLKLKAFV